MASNSVITLLYTVHAGTFVCHCRSGDHLSWGVTNSGATNINVAWHNCGHLRVCHGPNSRREASELCELCKCAEFGAWTVELRTNNDEARSRQTMNLHHAAALTMVGWYLMNHQLRKT
jgi:hypothetical protein